MLAVCEAEGARAVPLVAARCVSGGPSTDDCYRTLRQSLLSPLRKAARVDGVLLALHGSMTTVSEDDPEGDLLQAVRKIVGHKVPVVATLDMHAHVTRRMVRQATGLVAFTRYPHDDAFTTGERAAQLLFRLLRGRERPVAALAKVPVLTSGIHGMTFGKAPMAHLTRRAREMEQDPEILSVSVFGVHPYNDLPGLGSGGLVISDNDPRLARRLALTLAEEYWDNRGISKGALVVDTPGPTPASVRHLPYRRMKRPWFPLDSDIPGLQPTVFLSEPPPSADWDRAPAMVRK